MDLMLLRVIQYYFINFLMKTMKKKSIVQRRRTVIEYVCNQV